MGRSKTIKLLWISTDQGHELLYLGWRLEKDYRRLFRAVANRKISRQGYQDLYISLYELLEEFRMFLDGIGGQFSEAKQARNQREDIRIIKRDTALERRFSAQTSIGQQIVPIIRQADSVFVTILYLGAQNLLKIDVIQDVLTEFGRYTSDLKRASRELKRVADNALNKEYRRVAHKI